MNYNGGGVYNGLQGGGVIAWGALEGGNGLGGGG